MMPSGRLERLFAMKTLFFLSALCAFSLAALPVIVVPKDARGPEKKAAEER